MVDDCKPAYEAVKNGVLEVFPMSQTNPLVMAFDKCMVDVLNVVPNLNFDCEFTLKQFYMMCESELKGTVINFIDVITLINGTFGFGEQK
jgi:hypothetical protein